MPKKRPGKGQLHRGPFNASQIEAALCRDGWTRVPGGRHLNYRHPQRPGKVSISAKWTSVKPGHDTWRGIEVQGGYTRKQLLRLLNGLPPD